MNVYKIEIMVIDHDSMGSKAIAETIENTRYPNRCIYPVVKSVTTKRIDWNDGNNPLNENSTHDKFYEELFEK